MDVVVVVVCMFKRNKGRMRKCDQNKEGKVVDGRRADATVVGQSNIHEWPWHVRTDMETVYGGDGDGVDAWKG